MMQSATGTSIGGVALAAWSVVGPLVGVLIGAYTANRNQRKHWIADNKRLEYRELITALVEASGRLIQLYLPGMAHGPKEQDDAFVAETKATITILDRVFIADALKELKLADRWTDALSNLRATSSVRQFVLVTETMRDDVIASAAKILN
jgi:hypothetical protein